MEDNYREIKKAEPCLKLIHMDQVEVEEIEWLFYPFIPYGKVTIIQGDPGYREIKKAEPCLKLIHMDQVEVEEIEWLFYPFIPYGKVTIIQGDPGEGKTTVVLQIIAKLTKGEAILSETSEGKSEETGVEPINVIYQTAEDGLGDTIKPRLLAAGADCSRVLVIDDQDQPLTMVDARLEEAIIQTKARLVVLDPIQGRGRLFQSLGN